MPADRSATPRAAYIHVPFCRHRCGYCNFTLVAGRDDLIDRYLVALARELSWLAEPRPVDTLFLGGGTPTHLPPSKLAELLGLARRWFPLMSDCELSIEANPIDVTVERIAVLRDFGVTRLSLGGQSFQPEKLAILQRDHAPDQIASAIDLARRAVRSVSLDLIFATPNESFVQWQSDLTQALSLELDHLSTYGLTFERGTQFWSRRRRGQLREPDDDTWRQMYALAIERLVAAGFEHYEISNFARPGHRCRHNEVYWRGEEYYAAGPGAARYVAGRREVNHRSTTTWIDRVLAGQSPVAESESLDPMDRARERLVLGLRTIEGIQPDEFASITGYTIEELAGAALRKHLSLGSLEISADRIRLTREGLFISDSIWPDFL